MSNLTPQFINEVKVTLRSGKTNEILYETTKPNTTSDDLLCPFSTIFTQPARGGNSTTPYVGDSPYCFILPDGPNWSGFVYDPANPWAPYCITANNSVDNAADPQWQGYVHGSGFTPPSTVFGQTKYFFQWTNLPQDFQLKGIGLTAWQTDNSDQVYGIGFQTTPYIPSVLIPQTLVILPASILVHGRNNGLETPDVLQITYFLSILGTS